MRLAISLACDCRAKWPVPSRCISQLIVKNSCIVWKQKTIQDAGNIGKSTTRVREKVTNRPPLPPFSKETAIQKVRLAEDAWNSREPVKVATAYSADSHWRNRAEFVNGTEEIVGFLKRKWTKELDYRLIKELWAFTENRIGVRFAYEWHDDSGNWYRAYGNENWEFNPDGLMQWRFACINDLPIKEAERKFTWPLGRRPDAHPGLSDLGL
jgi:nuclear transport factor 2 (NTF2) superfamily protein